LGYACLAASAAEEQVDMTRAHRGTRQLVTLAVAEKHIVGEASRRTPQT